MNERLEKELDRFWNVELNPSDPVNCFKVAQLTAQHFYNLALEDIRKEMESKIKQQGWCILDQKEADGFQHACEYVIGLTKNLPR